MLDHIFVALLRATDAQSRADIIRLNYYESFLDEGKRRRKGGKVAETVPCMLYFKVFARSPTASQCGLFN